MHMSRLGLSGWGIGLGIALAVGSAWADNSPFVGRWHLNRAESILPQGEPVPKDLVAEISQANSARVKWSLTVVAAQGQSNVETFDVVANGDFHPINSDTTAAFTVNGSLLQSTFKGPNGETDTLTCGLSADQRKMTCRGTVSDGNGRTTTYVDVFDRM
jgi:hypothetical protein